MSGPPQTPIRYAPNQQQFMRPGTPRQMAMSPAGQRPMMQFRPGVPLQTPQQQQQQMLLAAAAAGRGAPLTPQQQAQLQQQFAQHHQQMRPGMMHPQAAMGMRPGMGAPPQQQQQQQQQQNPFAFTGGTSMTVGGVGLQGQQPHPALIQPPTPTGQQRRAGSGTPTQGRKAAGKPDDEEGTGDELDSMQPYSISVARYRTNHNTMADIFVALPTSTIDVPKHYYQDMDRAGLDAALERAQGEIEESKAEHGQRMEAQKASRDEFAELIQVLASTKSADADQIRQTVGERFGMAFVDDPYRPVARVEIKSAPSTEGAVYKQL
ncbi:hypothetical protein GGF46_004804 [Coemansia sp. RSA 552]|nr:hypothetical protein GGF46_004804 [Coemansia sp. RSA 552]